jgi:hypothetical protein
MRRPPEPLPHRHQNNARRLLDRRAIEIWRGERKVATIKPDVLRSVICRLAACDVSGGDRRGSRRH